MLLSKIKQLALRMKAGDILPVDKHEQNKSAELQRAGHSFLQEGDFDLAIQFYLDALQVNPINTDALIGLGLLLSKKDHLEDASDALLLVNQLIEKNYESNYILGKIELLKKNPKEADKFFKVASEIKEDFIPAITRHLCCMQYVEEYTAKDYLKVAKQFDSAMMKGITPCVWDKSEIKNKEKIKIGFASGNFENKSIAYFLEGLLKEINREKFILVAYSMNNDEGSNFLRLKTYFDHWVYVGSAGNMDMAARIIEDEVDILIDLAGHLNKNILPVLAYKPAPIQINWLGFSGTSGLRTIDYILADQTSVPYEEQKYFSEKVVYLPTTRLSFYPPHLKEDNYPSELPVKEKGYFTFGCYQEIEKINDKVLKIWSKILAQAPHAHIRFQVDFKNEKEKTIFLKRLQEAKIPEERIILAEISPREDYLHSYAQVDMVLDTFPYNGRTTTCEALWMGVPTLTLRGDSMPSRQGAVLLSAIDLPDWIANSKEEYIHKAIEFSNDLETLEILRYGLRKKMEDSALGNAQLIAKNFEMALMHICEMQKKLPPEEAI